MRMTEEVSGEKKKAGLFRKFTERLTATRKTLFGRAADMLRSGRKVDEALLEELEEVLITADVGVETTMHLVGAIREAAKEAKGQSLDEVWLHDTLRGILLETLGQSRSQLAWASTPPTVLLVVGVNGVGKTTTIAKLAHQFRREGKTALLAAADTFRAAAIDQLEIWAERVGAPIIKGQEGSDPAAVVFDAIRSARSRNLDAVIIDTAGRLHTKTNLMQELGKIGKIAAREIPDAPHETLLVVDASTGQNGLSQAKLFTGVVPISGLILTKLDGTAKGGVVLAVHQQLDLPVKYVGLGEGMEDLEVFDPNLFVEAILPAPAETI